MKVPWRSPVETASVEEAPDESQGPQIETLSSPGLEEALRGFLDEGDCRVLDLGCAVPSNVEYLSAVASKIQIVDAIDRDQRAGSAEGSGVCRLSSLRSLIDGHRNSFNLVLLWDVINYLTPEQAERVLAVVAELCLPNARLHAIIFATDTMPDLPNRYRIVDGARLAYEATTTELRGAPSLPPAAVEKLLEGFRIEHSFVLRHGVHEYVASKD
jgi:hypothetical protein